MKAVIIEPGKGAHIKEIDGDLKSLQSIVGGYIEAIYPFEDNVGVICNEEGKFDGECEPNFGLYDEDGELYDIICGTAIIVGLSADDFCSLSDELAEKYYTMYQYPAVFIKQDNGSITEMRIHQI